ncbi:MAG: class I SAM-dependent DNA methyltransferase [Hyphomicrobium sp.]
MAVKHGRVGYDAIDWFNGGLFEDGAALPLTRDDIKVALEAATQNWSEINPSIMGTLFERGLDPSKRSQLGAHYTDAKKIMMIVRPVIIEPLLRDWEAARAEIETKLAQAKVAKSAGAKTKAKNEAEALRIAFIERLKNFRVLDPACGSGNFLYVALKSLKDIEARVNIEAESLGLEPQVPLVGPECVKGIEINPFAADLARVSVWIGEIQWMREKGFGVSKNPILKPLDTIECRDALLNPDGTEAEWPDADVIIGNPPFLGSQLFVEHLGEHYTRVLRDTYSDQLPGTADLVVYWFHKSSEALTAGLFERVGLVATNSIRGGSNNVTLKRIVENERIFEAWSDEPWVVDGAAVRVSIICFDDGSKDVPLKLDGSLAPEIFSDLTSNLDLSAVTRLKHNGKIAYQGPVKVGSFDIAGDLARTWLVNPYNPHGKPNTDVVRPWTNGRDVVQRPTDTWIVDFAEMSEQEAALYQQPFEYARKIILPERSSNRRERRKRLWWQHGETVPTIRRLFAELSQCMITPRVAKHRLFVWRSPRILPDSATVAIARDDDTTFGILHSKFHELWSLRLGTSLEDRPRYTPTTCFETFPFPEDLTPNIPAADYAADPRAQSIAKAAARLNELRENWLNPPDLVQRVPEVVPGYPDRILPVDDKAAAILKYRTLTKLYNERPAWLDHAHRDLDAAVASAYGWPTNLTDEEILERLFTLNQERAARQAQT